MLADNPFVEYVKHGLSYWLLDSATGVDSDLNGDSVVDLQDFRILSEEWR